MIRQAIAVIRPRSGDARWSAAHLAQAFGDLLRRRQDRVRTVQWAFVAVYLSLLLLPVLLPLTPVDPAVGRQIGQAAEILFWGIWWPGVILSVMLVGQFWCGVLCPDGTLTEFASRHGRGGKIPAWLRRSGWPVLGFSLIFTWEHLVDAYGQPTLVLLSVGGVSLLALSTGLLVGRGKRVWCRYACPATSIFSLLSRCAVLHFKVDRAAWDAAPRPQPTPVDCPVLLDVRRLRSNEKCSMCGRCSGHRKAVALALRPPGAEIVGVAGDELRPADALSICFLLAGLAYAVLHFPGSGMHGAALTQALSTGLPVWGAKGLVMLAAAGAVGATLLALLRLAGGSLRHAAYLAGTLIPLAGIGLFLGALDYAFLLLARAGHAAADLRFVVHAGAIFVGTTWSAVLAVALVRRSTGGRWRYAFLFAAIAGLAALLLAASGMPA